MKKIEEKNELARRQKILAKQNLRQKIIPQASTTMKSGSSGNEEDFTVGIEEV